MKRYICAQHGFRELIWSVEYLYRGNVSFFRIIFEVLDVALVMTAHQRASSKRLFWSQKRKGNHLSFRQFLVRKHQVEMPFQLSTGLQKCMKGSLLREAFEVQALYFPFPYQICSGSDFFRNMQRYAPCDNQAMLLNHCILFYCNGTLLHPKQPMLQTSLPILYNFLILPNRQFRAKRSATKISENNQQILSICDHNAMIPCEYIHIIGIRNSHKMMTRLSVFLSSTPPMQMWFITTVHP